MENYIDGGLENYVILDEDEIQAIEETISSLVSEGIWKMTFDGACLKSRFGAGVTLEFPSGEVYLHSFCLQFPCTKNVTKYEELIQGILLEKEMHIQSL